MNEIDVIKAEIIDLNQEENVKREVECALTKLRKLQLFSDDITELLRCKYNIIYSECVTDVSKQL